MLANQHPKQNYIQTLCAKLVLMKAVLTELFDF